MRNATKIKNFPKALPPHFLACSPQPRQAVAGKDGWVKIRRIFGKSPLLFIQIPEKPVLKKLFCSFFRGFVI